MVQRKLMLSCAVGALALSASVAAAQTQTAVTTQQLTGSAAETPDQAKRAQATSQSTEAASAAVVGELIITAQSHEQSLQSTPIAVSAYTDERRNLVGIETASDIVNFTPSMSLNGEFLSLRGVGRYTLYIGIDPGVPLFVDGIYTASPDYLNQPDIFTDRIEVLRGPQGTLSGRNAIGGLVNVVEKRPTDEFHEEARAGATDYSYWYTSGSVSGPITDHLSFRLADAYGDQPQGSGFVKNLANPIYPGSGWTNLFEAQLEWKPTSNFDAWFKLQNFAADTAATYGVNPDQYPRFPANSAFGSNCPTRNGITFQCLVQNPTALLAPTSNPEIANRWVVNDNVSGFNKTNDDWTFSTQMALSLPGARLEYTGGYSQYNFAYLSDADGTPSVAPTPALGAIISQITTGYQFENWYQNELELKSDNDSRLQWIVGGFQYWDHYIAPYNNEEPGNAALATPSTGGPNPSRAYYAQVAHLTSTSYAVFGNLDYSLTDTLRLTGGLRYSWDNKQGEVTNRQIFDTAGIFFAPGLGTLDVTAPNERDQFVQRGSADWTGKIGVEWKPDPTTLVYGSITKGYKAASVALIPLHPIPTVGPETLYDFEAGVKKTFGDKLLIDADIYYYDYHNLQQLESVQTAQGFTLQSLVSAQKARTYGFELESVWSPTKDFQLTFNYSYLNARFVRFSDPAGGSILDFSQLAPGCVGTGPAGPPGTAGQCNPTAYANLNGNVIPQSPENKVTLNPVYTMIFPIGKITLSGTYAFVDKQYYSYFNTQNFLAPAYSNLDLRLLYQPQRGHYTFILYARNVTDATQIVNYSTGSFVGGPANTITAPAQVPSRGQITYYVNAPRVVGGEVQVRF